MNVITVQDLEIKMEIRIVEASNDGQNYGKFAIGRWTDEEWDHRMTGIGGTAGLPLLPDIG